MEAIDRGSHPPRCVDNIQHRGQPFMGNPVVGFLEIDPAHTQGSKSLEFGISDHHLVHGQTVHATSGPPPLEVDRWPLLYVDVLYAAQ